MLNNQQVKLIQTAVRKAGLRGKNCDGRYRFLLSQHKQSNGKPVTSCKQLNNSQLVDMLAICESLGWRCPGKKSDHFRVKAAEAAHVASYGQQAAIGHLAGDLGWNDLQLGGMIKRMTGGKASSVAALSPAQAWKIIEALKAILSRKAGRQYTTLSEVTEDFGKEHAKDGKENNTRKIG